MTLKEGKANIGSEVVCTVHHPLHGRVFELVQAYRKPIDELCGYLLATIKDKDTGERHSVFLSTVELSGASREALTTVDFDS